MEHDQPGRCSHGFCLHGIRQRRSRGVYANTSDHKFDGWSEYAVSKDNGKTWARYNKFPYSKRPNRPTETTGLGEKGLVTERNTVVLFLSRFDNGERTGSGVVHSSDRGTTWIKHRWTAILSAL
jgi:hypothetical protein